jgi:hypothetical protein
MGADEDGCRRRQCRIGDVAAAAVDAPEAPQRYGRNRQDQEDCGRDAELESELQEVAMRIRCMTVKRGVGIALER